MKPGMTPKWTLMNILLPAAQDAESVERVAPIDEARLFSMAVGV